MDELQEIHKLLIENNKLLKEIRDKLNTILSDNDYSQEQDMRAFVINVAADLFVSILTDDQKEIITKGFKR